MRKSKNQAAALDHVLYEIEMLTHALLTLPRGDLSPPEECVASSIAIHRET